MMLSVDPGDSTGWARWTDDGILYDHGINSAHDFMLRLAMMQKEPPATIVYENYRLDYRAAKQRGSNLWASQVIGAIKMFSTLYPGIITVAQGVEAKTIAALHSGIRVPSDHKLSHDYDAVLHGWYYWDCVEVEPNTAML